MVRVGRGHQRRGEIYLRAEPRDSGHSAGSRPEIEVINPDLITQEIQRSTLGLPTGEANVRAANECERRVKDLINSGDHSFVIETVLSTEKYKPIVRAALRKGF